MKCNIIILFEKKRTRQLNICLDNLPTEMNCYMVSSFHEGIYQVMRYNYDLIIISVLKSMEFTEQAIEGIRRLKKTPILALIPYSVEWKEQCIRAGVDQVLWETNDDWELELAVCALVRRYRWNANEQGEYRIVQEGALILDYTDHSATWNGQTLNLVKREFDFLFLLAATPGRIYTYEQIYRVICEEAEPENIDNLLWCMVHRLKKKLSETNPRLKGLVQSRKNVGYYFHRLPDI